MANFIVWVVWCGAAFACIASALGVISFRNPFFSALALIGNLASLAVLYLLLNAEFVAAAQVLVYAGAVMVMFLFVIAYFGDKADVSAPRKRPTWLEYAEVPAAGDHVVPPRGRLPLLDRRARGAAAPESADRAALSRDHAQRREPRADRIRAPAGRPRRSDLRARRDGGRRVRGRRRPGADRRDGAAEARARRRPHDDSQRMTEPLVIQVPYHLGRERVGPGTGVEPIVDAIGGETVGVDRG